MQKIEKIWKVLELLNWSAEYLSARGIENARLNAERLLGRILNSDRVQLYLDFDRPLTEAELLRFKEYIKRRLGHEPLQYILQECEFMSLRFKVNPGVMIPRPESEVLVETVLETCREKFPSKNPIRILEVGTGSGCIAVSLAKHLPVVRVTAIDISDEALKIAAENARLNEVDDRIQFRQLDFMRADFPKQLSEIFDVLVSNPPYISDKDFPNLPVEIKEFEPLIALKNGSDGLSFYHRISQLSSSLLNPSGLVAVEVGLGQAAMVEKIFLEHTFSKVTSYKDLNGIERVVCGEIGNTTK